MDSRALKQLLRETSGRTAENLTPRGSKCAGTPQNANATGWPSSSIRPTTTRNRSDHEGKGARTSFFSRDTSFQCCPEVTRIAAGKNVHPTQQWALCSMGGFRDSKRTIRVIAEAYSGGPNGR